MTGFDAATGLVPAGDGAFSWDVPDGWQQGRGAWGGLVVGALVRAVTSVEPAPVRSIGVQLSAPAVVGPHTLTVDLVRRGSSMTTWRAALTASSGEPVAALVAIAGAERSSAERSATWGVRAAPVLPAPDDVPVLPIEPPLGPVFGRHCEFRPVAGIPLSGQPARCAGWVRLRQSPAPSAAWLLGLVDAWWPASMPAFDTMVRIATVNFTANLLVDPSEVDPASPLRYEATVDAAADGFTSEHRALWTADGRLAVDNLQTIVVG